MASLVGGRADHKGGTKESGSGVSDSSSSLLLKSLTSNCWLDCLEGEIEAREEKDCDDFLVVVVVVVVVFVLPTIGLNSGVVVDWG